MQQVDCAAMCGSAFDFLCLVCVVVHRRFGCFRFRPLSIVVFEPFSYVHPGSAAGVDSWVGIIILLVVPTPADNGTAVHQSYQYVE